MTKPQKPTHGGRRKGAGRKPAGKPRKEPLSLRVSPDVRSYLNTTANASATVEEALRGSQGFRSWARGEEKS